MNRIFHYGLLRAMYETIVIETFPVLGPHHANLRKYNYMILLLKGMSPIRTYVPVSVILCSVLFTGWEEVSFVYCVIRLSCVRFLSNTIFSVLLGLIVAEKKYSINVRLMISNWYIIIMFILHTYNSLIQPIHLILLFLITST